MVVRVRLGRLWMLSGLDAARIDARTRTRLSSRLKAMDAEALVHACRRRAEVWRCRASESFLDELRTGLVLSGTSAAGQFGLVGETSKVEGYCASAAWTAIRSQFRLVDDARGNATIRVTTQSSVLRGGYTTMPSAVVAVDLAESYEPRERAAGLRALQEMLG